MVKIKNLATSCNIICMTVPDIAMAIWTNTFFAPVAPVSPTARTVNDHLHLDHGLFRVSSGMAGVENTPFSHPAVASPQTISNYH